MARKRPDYKKANADADYQHRRKYKQRWLCSQRNGASENLINKIQGSKDWRLTVRIQLKWAGFIIFEDSGVSFRSRYLNFDFSNHFLLSILRISMIQQLHPYWRMDYIEGAKDSSLERPFTQLPQLGDDRAAHIVYRSPHAYLMLNRYPYNPGHLLAIPFREVADPEELTQEEAADLFQTIIFAKKLLREAINPNAFNIGFNLGSASGGSIPHLHCHIVPRWAGDTNFMPVIGQTRVLPQALDSTWEHLVAAVARLTP